MRLAELTAASSAVAAAPARSAKVDLLADLLRRAAPGEVALAVCYLSGDLPQRRTGVGWAALREMPEPAARASLTLVEVNAAFDRMAARVGPGSAAARRGWLAGLFGRADRAEQRLLGALVAGELRQGALAGVMVEAVAKAAGVPAEQVRTALTLCGELPAVATAALTGGTGALARFRLQLGRPLAPMLAGTAASVTDALSRLGRAAVEWKLDGVRVQVHRTGDDVSVFTRTLDDVTARCPELVATARTLPLRQAVLDGEAIGLRPDGRPRPFQQTAARVASRVGRGDVPLTWFVFDLLHLDGTDLLTAPAGERHAVAAAVLPQQLVVPRTVTDRPAAADDFLSDALARGHEGVVVKSLSAPYAAGRRGAGWLKVKPVHTLDLVVLAAEWGHGRRRGWLSNLHLGARDPVAGGFVMLGKTFKGLTDEVLRWQTEQLLARATDHGALVVRVRPELVVEVAFDGVQRSPRYPGGAALRFARVLRYRPDKPAEQADTLDAVLALRG